jgi:hypothetical protein
MPNSNQTIYLNYVKPVTKYLRRTSPSLFKIFLFFYHRFNRLKYFLNALFLLLKQEITGKREIITSSEASYFGDHFATIHYVAFLNDNKFIESYNNSFLNVDPNIVNIIRSQDISWRAHIVTWAANQALKLEGDFVECGVWWGLLSKVICQYTDFEKQDKVFYFFDSWGDPNLLEKNHKNYDKDVFVSVKKRFLKYPNVKFVRGLVPEVLENVKIEKISYLSIDMNGSIAERFALEKFYDIIVPGGIIYFDDYGWGYPELRETIDDFFKNKPEKLLHFPSGNSIIIKI